MGNRVQKLVKTKKVATMMLDRTITIPTETCAAEVLGLKSGASQENPESQSDSWTGVEKPSMKNLDLIHVPMGHRERL